MAEHFFFLKNKKGACLKNFGDLHRNLEDLRSDLVIEN